MLDSYSNVSRIADTWRSFGMQLTDPSFVSRARMAAPLSAGAPGTAGIVKVSNPSNDFAFSSFGGFTQRDFDSTLRKPGGCRIQQLRQCVRNSFLFNWNRRSSLQRPSCSTNGGASFTDIGPMNPGTADGNFLGEIRA